MNTGVMDYAGTTTLPAAETTSYNHGFGFLDFTHSQLCVPQHDDLAELELSTMLGEDSFSNEELENLQLIKGMSTIRSDVDRPRPRKKARDNSEGRKCTHCSADSTPQWRSGPTGPKTLCNACGVRYKSGRLVPEYRPLASPTFVPTKHSNSHRKVMELRRQKDLSIDNDEQRRRHHYSVANGDGSSNYFMY